MTIKENDLLLVSQVKLFNSHKAFEKIVKKYQSQIRRLFLNLTQRNEFLSDDLAQETFIKVFLNIHSFRSNAKFSTWLYRVAYNVFLDYKKTNYRKFDYKLPDNNINFAYQQKIHVDNELNHLLHILKSEEKEVIVLSYIEEISHKDISEILNMPLGTVKTHIKRGKEKLLKILKENNYERYR
ncbi:MAG: sigma-70 family RNA polymerase sigma factor [Bacteroidales bacterium]|jgi:RNA polymerase sigma-70 factor (ECF subfamily)|nr:sigma-70 family RNA polymerase sigma factor [Bacteroidales bacterium]